MRATRTRTAASALDLPQIAKDLDSIRTDLNSAGARLVVCSFKWFADAGIGFSPTRHEYIYKHLNTYLWPVRYSDIRRLADFQKPVLPQLRRRTRNRV